MVETSATCPYASARHLYETSGYRREAAVHNFYAPGDDLLIYIKDLKTDQEGIELMEIHRSGPDDGLAVAPASSVY
jgi:hypothetical protein